MAKIPFIFKTVRKGSRIVKIDNQNTARIFQSRLYVNRGETATLTHAEHKTLQGALRWADKVLKR